MVDGQSTEDTAHLVISWKAEVPPSSRAREPESSANTIIVRRSMPP